MFPEKQKRGFRVHREKENQILDALLKGRALPGLYASQTPKGVQILGGGGSSAEHRSIRPQLDGDNLWFTNGLVDNNEPEIGGDPIGDSPAPTIAVTTSPFYAWIMIEWEPGNYYDGTDYLPWGGTLQTPIVIAGGSSVPSNVAPAVNSATGAVTTNGEFYFQIAKVVGSSGSYAIDSERSGNRTYILCNDADVQLRWDSP